VIISRKAALSLLISVFLFVGFAVLSFTGLFDLIETHFYNPSIIKSLNREVDQDAETVGDFFTELQNRFSRTLQEIPVKRSFLPNQSAEDIFERSRLFGILQESLGGLQSIRFIDSGGSRIHYSTSGEDILRQDRLSVAYRNYNDSPGYIPYGEVSVPEQGEPKLTLDETEERILFSFPFYDSFEVYRGTALFSLSVRAVAEQLINEGRIKLGEDISIRSFPPGIVSGLPYSGRNVLLPMVSSIWNEGILSLTTLDSAASGTRMALISAKTSQGIYIGRLVDINLFSFPLGMKIILLAAFFLTLYLSIFLAFNLRQDSMTIIQNRLKNLQVSLIEEYYDRKNDMDWGRWGRDLEQRREDVRAELKRGIKSKLGNQENQDIDSFIDKSWDELLAVIGGQRNKITANIDEDKLQTILHRVLLASPPGGTALPPVQTQAAGSTPAQPQPPPAEEELEELDSEALDAPEELEEVETLDAADEPEELAEVPEDLDEAEDLEPLEDGEELAKIPEVLDAVDEPEELEDVDEGESLEDLEDVEELAEIPEDADNAEALEEPEELAEVPEALDEVESLEAAEEPEELTEVPENAETPVTAGAQKQSNIRLVFGDDDIPYIMETSGLELVDEDIDSVLSSMRPDDEPAALEELDELDEEDAGMATPPGKSPEKARELEDVEFPADPSNLGVLSEETLNNLTSEIEFSELPDTDTADIPLDNEFEIVSPFATMLSDFSGKDDTGEEIPEAPLEEEEPQSLTGDDNPEVEEIDSEQTDQISHETVKLDELEGHTGSLVYKPFTIRDQATPPNLETLQHTEEEEPELIPPVDNVEDVPESSGPETIIEERDGIHYVTESVLTPDEKTEQNLDPGFKNLIDSVLKKD
jgi:hypothetical protein